ncbi:MAG: acyltransferase [Siphonobacter sp.]
MEPRKYEYIDSLRGIAILLVLLVHASQLGSRLTFFPKPLADFITNGQFGVQLFFIVSSYTLMLSYESRRTETHATRNFFLRRFFRIAPMYYLAVVYYALGRASNFHFSSFSRSKLNLLEILANLGFTHGFSPSFINHFVPGGWSIAVEMCFYCVLPLLYRKIRNLNDSLLLVVGSLLFSVGLNLLLKETSIGKYRFLYYYFPNQFPVFSLGILAYFIIKRPERIKSDTLLILVLSLFILSYLSIPAHFQYGLLFFVLIVTLAKKPYPFFCNRILSYIGQISFSIYLIHFVLLHWLVSYKQVDFIPVTNFITASANFLIRYSILLGVSGVVAHFTYQYIEIPGQRLSKRFLKRKVAVLEPA